MVEDCSTTEEEEDSTTVEVGVEDTKDVEGVLDSTTEDKVEETEEEEAKVLETKVDVGTRVVSGAAEEASKLAITSSSTETDEGVAEDRGAEDREALEDVTIDAAEETSKLATASSAETDEGVAEIRAALEDETLGAAKVDVVEVTEAA